MLYKFKLSPLYVTAKKLFGENLKILIYDIETKPLKAWLWRLGENTVRHAQLDKAYSQYGITTIAYKWLGEDDVYCLTGEGMIEKFDILVKEADVVIGKNSDRFDAKHINAQRLMQGLPGMPQWASISDDLEKQLRRYFIFPSMSLDYISNILGFGGKVKMEMSDWIDIENGELINKIENVLKLKLNSVTASFICKILCPILFKDNYTTIKKLYKIAIAEMIFYNKKDVLDTEGVLIKVAPHIKLRRNNAVVVNTANQYVGGLRCIKCNTSIKNLMPTKKIVVGTTRYQQWECESCGQYAGRCTIKLTPTGNKVYGQMQNN